MKLTLNCPRASYDAQMRIRCAAAGDLCGHQRFKPCKGWCVLTDQAGKCPLREGKEDGESHKAGASHRVAL